MPFKDELASINSSETPISPEAKEDLYKSKKDEARNYCADPSEPSAQKFDENTGQKLVEEPERSKARQMVQRAITNMEGVLGLNTSSKFGSERGSKLPIPNKETPTTYYDELLQRYDGLKIEMLAHVDTLVERGVTILSADPETGTDFVKGMSRPRFFIHEIYVPMRQFFRQFLLHSCSEIAC